MTAPRAALLAGALFALVTIAAATNTCSFGRLFDSSASKCLCDGARDGVRGSCKAARAKDTSKCDSSKGWLFGTSNICKCKSGTLFDGRGTCKACTSKSTSSSCTPQPTCPSGRKDGGSGKCVCDSTIPAEKRTAKDSCKCTLAQGTGGCGDPHFVGGNGVRYDFHGVPEKSFCLISDKAFHLNAHFIGQNGLETGMDGTWMDQLGFVFVAGNKQHSLSVHLVSEEDFASNVSDVFLVEYDASPVRVSLPASGRNVWTSDDGLVTISRTSETAKLTLTLKGHFQTTLTASEHEFPDGHHIDFDVDVMNITSSAHGILGQTFQPERLHVVAGSSELKMDQADVVEGGDHDYISSDLMATDCKFSRFSAPSLVSLTRRLMGGSRLEEPVFSHSLRCSSDAGYVSCLI
ncbi:putative root cap family protein [Klebsormidium nitens]|uniref:Putative root cap family protein n=1 Tax=Klebsormidium nitens TaxID=105231 RepID=A0A1Y1HKZ9_KLENI|nr:putative root cap family protein [Klebsormidium nitens]|eukprot:GAQ78643.1 putative root cap family protein [Klebsormidium nitens]